MEVIVELFVFTACIITQAAIKSLYLCHTAVFILSGKLSWRLPLIFSAVARSLISCKAMFLCFLCFRIDTNGPPGVRRARQTYSRFQTLELEKEFERNSYLTRAQRIVISQILGLSERQIKIWFQNRRMKHKRERQKTKGMNHSLHVSYNL